MGGESGDGSRSAALVGMVCSGLTVAACLLVVPLIQTRLTAWQEDVALRMAAFKSLTDDSWREMMTLRRELRIKRDAETDEDLVDIEELLGEGMFGVTDDFDKDGKLLPGPDTVDAKSEFDGLPDAGQESDWLEDSFLARRPPVHLDLGHRLPSRRIGETRWQRPPSSKRGAVRSRWGPSGKPRKPNAAERRRQIAARQNRAPQDAVSGRRRVKASRLKLSSNGAETEESGYTAAPRVDAAPQRRAQGSSYQPAPARRPQPAPYAPQSPRRKPQPSYAQQSPRKPRGKCNCKKLTCPAGAPGNPGTAGRDGRQGTQGGTGLPGLDAPDMEPVVVEAPCQTCPQGPTGPTGEPGLPGPQGNKGRNGAHGIPGRHGHHGVMGGKGPVGPEGPVGKAGTVGMVGLDLLGGKGVPGPKGKAGGAGAPGLPGPEGKSFRLPGSPGARGPPGRAGYKGDDGYPGLPGVPGEKGEVGKDAAYCKCPLRSQRPYYQGDADDQSDYVRFKQKQRK